MAAGTPSIASFAMWSLESNLAPSRVPAKTHSFAQNPNESGARGIGMEGIVIYLTDTFRVFP